MKKKTSCIYVKYVIQYHGLYYAIHYLFKAQQFHAREINQDCVDYICIYVHKMHYVSNSQINK